MNEKSLTTLASLKDYLNIGSSDTNINTYLESLIDGVSSKVEQFLHRNIRLANYIEYQDGKGLEMLYLKQYPVKSITSIYDDIDRSFGSTTEVDSDDYTYDPDTGIVYYDSGYFSNGIRNVKITYMAGYEDFVIIAGYNDKLNFNEGGAEFSATLTAGTYYGATLAAHIKATMEAIESVAGTYTITYNRITGKFTIASNQATFQILWLTGTNTLTSVGSTMGFIVTANDTGATSYTSDNPVLGIPKEIEVAVWMWVTDIYNQSRKGTGGGRQGFDSESRPDGISVKWLNEPIPLRVVAMLNPYRKMLV